MLAADLAIPRTAEQAGAGRMYRTVVEVEVEGERQLCIGVHQAIKYRSLAAADAGFPLLTSRVRSVVVAYAVDYPKARDLAERYDIPLLAANRETVLAGAR
jgi:hypothetical protein